ncbi:MAG: hypothetical protein ACYDCG_18325 [Candidatus Acidiferrales bacterium]
MTSILEQTKQKHHDRLVELDEDRQGPQTKLADKRAAVAQLREKLAALQPRDPANEKAIKTLRSEIVGVEREVTALESQLTKIDGAAREIHEQIRAIELPEDEAKLRDWAEVIRVVLNDARYFLAQYCVADREFVAKHGEEGHRRAAAIRGEFQDRENHIQREGWTLLDAVEVKIRPIHILPMWPPGPKVKP